MKNKNWACPLIATAMASILIMYGHWIPVTIGVSYWFKKVYKPYGRKCHSRQTVARKVDLHCVELKP